MRARADAAPGPASPRCSRWRSGLRAVALLGGFSVSTPVRLLQGGALVVLGDPRRRRADDVARPAAGGLERARVRGGVRAHRRGDRAPRARRRRRRARRDRVHGPRSLRRRGLRGARARGDGRAARPAAARAGAQRRGRHLRRRAQGRAPTASTTATASPATTSPTGSSSTATRCAATSATTPTCCATRSRAPSATSSRTTSAPTSSACATSACRAPCRSTIVHAGATGAPRGLRASRRRAVRERRCRPRAAACTSSLMPGELTHGDRRDRRSGRASLELGLEGDGRRRPRRADLAALQSSRSLASSAIATSRELLRDRRATRTVGGGDDVLPDRRARARSRRPPSRRSAVAGGGARPAAPRCCAAARSSRARRRSRSRAWARRRWRSSSRRARRPGCRSSPSCSTPGTPRPIGAVADVVQIGARNMQNYALLEVAGRLGKPVLLKRGLSSSLDELLMAADYVLKEGTEEVILCERGIRTFETATRFTLDLGAVPWLKMHTHLPVIVDRAARHVARATGGWSSRCRAPRPRSAPTAIIVEVQPRLPSTRAATARSRCAARGLRRRTRAPSRRTRVVIAASGERCVGLRSRGRRPRIG